jgi:hypothetical protein
MSKREIAEYSVGQSGKESQIYKNASDAAHAWFDMVPSRSAGVIAKYQDGSASTYASVSSANGILRKSVPAAFEEVFHQRLAKELSEYTAAHPAVGQLARPEERSSYSGPVVGESPNFFYQRDQNSGSVIAHEKRAVAYGGESVKSDANLEVRYPHGYAALIKQSEPAQGLERARDRQLNIGKDLER